MSHIELHTRTGELVTTVQDAVVAVMAHNGQAPEVLVWGDRVFVLINPDAYGKRGNLRYREGLAWPLRTGEPLEIPLHSVDGTPAGKTMLLAGTDAQIHGLTPAGSDNPPTEKMTESYIPEEFETAGAFLAWAGTDARRWAADFMRRFAGLIMPGALDDGTMIGWFASAIETGRSAGYAEGAGVLLDRSKYVERSEYDGACQTVAEMHAAAVGEVTGPGADGPVADVARLRAAYLEAQQEAQTPSAVNEILEGAPESWGEDAAADHIAVQYVREMERRLNAYGITREKYVEERQPGRGGVPMKLAMGETDPIVTCGCGNRFHGDSINDAVTNWTAHVTQGGCPLKEWL